MAVSKPRPKRSADRVHLPRRVHPAGERPEEPVHQPALVELLLKLIVVVPPAAHRPEHLDDAGQDNDVQPGDDVKERSRHARADDPGHAVQSGAAVFYLVVEGADAEVQEDRQHEHDAGVPEGEEEAHRQRPLAVIDELAGGVVDGRDVVGVEGMPHAERVGQDAGAEAEDLGPADVVVPADGGGQHDPAEYVEADDDAGHDPRPGPLPRGQPVLDPLEPPRRP